MNILRFRQMLTRSLRWQSVRFLIIGALNTCVGYAIYIVGLVFGLIPETALAIATVLGAAFNYFSTGRLVFDYAALDRLPRFFLAYGIVYILNVAALRWLMRYLDNPALAQAILLPVVALVSFLVLRQLVFGKKPAK